MERFCYNMRCRTKDNFILEDFYNQCDSDYYISYVQWRRGSYRIYKTIDYAMCLETVCLVV